MKRLALTLSAIGFSATIFAALPATTDPTLVAVPQLPGGFVVGATGYYLQPSFSHGDLDYASVNVGTTSPFSSRLRAVEPGYDWGWGVNLGYIFPNTGNDVNLSYFHLNTDERDSIFPGNSVFPFLTADIIAAVDIVINNYIATAKTEYDLNRVDLTTGQFIDVGCRLILHPSVGLSYLSLNRDLDSSFLGAVTAVFAAPVLETLRDATTIQEKSEFDGIGPLANIDASYYLGLGFGLVAHADAGIYIGDLDAKTNAIRNVSATLFPVPLLTTSATANNSFSVNSNRRIVPVTEIKLGGDYTYVFNNAANSDLTVEVGYQVSHYFNAIDRVTGTLSNALANDPGTGFTFSSPILTRRTTSDLGLNGPYVNLTLHI